MSDIRTLVADYLGIRPQLGDEWTIVCPSPLHADARPSASIYVGEPMNRARGGRIVSRLPGMWICYACGAHGRISSEEIRTYTPDTDRNLELVELDLTQLETETHVYPESWLDLFDSGPVHPYWLTRFPEQVCRAWRLGYDYQKDALTYPLRGADGSVLGVVHRTLDQQATGWKYRYPAGVEKSELLFGYHEAVEAQAETLAVCEGALDAIACWEAGQPAVAILGSRISPAQVRLLNRYFPDRLVCCFDADEAGTLAEASVQNSELVCFDLATVVLPPGVKDIAEIDVATRRRVLADAQSIT